MSPSQNITVWDGKRSAKSQQAHKHGPDVQLWLNKRADAGEEDELEKYDVVLGLVHQMLMHADWQLDMLEDWGAAAYDPVAWVFENAWHGQVKYKWDPLVAAFGMKAPTARYELSTTAPLCEF